MWKLYNDLDKFWNPDDNSAIFNIFFVEQFTSVGRTISIF